MESIDWTQKALFWREIKLTCIAVGRGGDAVGVVLGEHVSQRAGVSLLSWSWRMDVLSKHKHWVYFKFTFFNSLEQGVFSMTHAVEYAEVSEVLILECFLCFVPRCVVTARATAWV